MKMELTRLIVDRLQSQSQKLKEDFQKLIHGIQTRYFVLDHLLPEEIAHKIFQSFPDTQQMRLLSSFRERKYTSKNLEKMDSLIADIIFALQAPPVIEVIGQITEFKELEGDPHLYAGGISSMLQGHYLNPHIDNSHDSFRKLYRALNVLYYITPNWKPHYGGNLELWNSQVKKRVEIPSLFNRLVIMETHRHSWHSVNTVATESKRCCVSNYYFSPHSPEGIDYFHVTSFSARPEQPIRRAFAYADNSVRNFVRKIVKSGVGKKDLYENFPPRH